MLKVAVMVLQLQPRSICRASRIGSLHAQVMGRTREGRADHLCDRAPLSTGPPALAALRAGGSSAARAVNRKHVHANRQGGDAVINSVACVLFEDLTAGEVVCIIPLVSFT